MAEKRTEDGEKIERSNLQLKGILGKGNKETKEEDSIKTIIFPINKEPEFLDAKYPAKCSKQ